MLSLTTTPGLASLWLIPRLSDFVARHPGVDVRIDASYPPRALAAVAGQGVALGRRPLVNGLLRQRALVAPIQRAKASAHGYTLVVEAAASRKPAVQALVNWLLAKAHDERLPTAAPRSHGRVLR